MVKKTNKSIVSSEFEKIRHKGHLIIGMEVLRITSVNEPELLIKYLKTNPYRF
jgi:hypothetical protein